MTGSDVNAAVLSGPVGIAAAETRIVLGAMRRTHHTVSLTRSRASHTHRMALIFLLLYPQCTVVPTEVGVTNTPTVLVL